MNQAEKEGKIFHPFVKYDVILVLIIKDKKMLFSFIEETYHFMLQWKIESISCFKHVCTVLDMLRKFYEITWGNKIYKVMK